MAVLLFLLPSSIPESLFSFVTTPAFLTTGKSLKIPVGLEVGEFDGLAEGCIVVGDSVGSSVIGAVVGREVGSEVGL